MTNDELWYKSAIFYQIYVRAFYDSNGDGHGDLKGLTSRLGYLQDLGVDCIWLMPIYPSPLKDDGYDIADYYNIAETFGTLDDLRSLLHEAHARGIRRKTVLTHPVFQMGQTNRQSRFEKWQKQGARGR